MMTLGQRAASLLHLLEETPTSLSFRKLYACVLCGSKYSSKVGLNNHYYKRHPLFFLENLKHYEEGNLYHVFKDVPDRVKVKLWDKSEIEIPFVLTPSMYRLIVVDGDYIRSRMDTCSTEKAVFGHIGEEVCDNFEERVISCDVRICSRCEGKRRGRYAHKYKVSLEGFKRVSVMTLTYRGHHPLDKERKKGLERSVRNFIKRLSRSVRWDVQYVRVLELVQKPDGYYYHYHFLIDMPYVKQTELSRMWGDVSDGSFVVWVEILKDENKQPIGAYWGRLPKKVRQSNVSNYVTKYLAKPLPHFDSDQYASFGYGVHFVETHFTCITGGNSSIKRGLVCSCGVRMKYLYTTSIGGLDGVT